METALARPETVQKNGTSIIAPVRVDTQGIDLFTLCRALAASGYFQDAKSEAQAVVKVLAGQELGISPIQAMMGIHVINGKPTLSAGLMASIIKRSGKYDYRITRLDDQACIIEGFVRAADGWQSLGERSFTMEDAKRAQLLTGGNRGNWEKWPRNMLFSRVISNFARWDAPDAFGGPIYTPDELGAEVGADGELTRLPSGQLVETATGAVMELPADSSGDSRASRAKRAVKANEQAPAFSGNTGAEDPSAAKARGAFFGVLSGSKERPGHIPELGGSQHSVLRHHFYAVLCGREEPVDPTRWSPEKAAKNWDGLNNRLAAHAAQCAGGSQCDVLVHACERAGVELSSLYQKPAVLTPETVDEAGAGGDPFEGD